ncbi:MAG: Tetratricopeptide repeat protein [Cyanobacteriota bacterium erpe_2018_sw_21hr_WHONDRS-SW48-000092_B_bin.40]|nr:Tetratricopeptide repeat protein [Cyanobacteriota bacterium erpe_2018_sw_21hr_WHONDRS-SW48-000092_B_bin.40]
MQKRAGLTLCLVLAITSTLSLSALLVKAEGSRYRPDTVAHMQQGIKFLRAKQLDQARGQFETVIKMEPSIPDAYNNIGLSYAYENKVDKAIQYYRKALDIEPLYVPALNNLGLVLYSTGKAEEALYYWRLCLKISGGQEPELHYYAANAMRDVGQKKEARENYLIAIKLDPTHAAAHSGLAALDLSEGRLDEAFSEVNKAIKLKPDSAFSYYHLGLIEERRHNVAAAIKAYETSLKYETVSKYAQETKNRIAKLNGTAPASGNLAQGQFTSGQDDQQGQSDDDGRSEMQASMRQAAREAMKRHAWAEAVHDFDSLIRTGAGEDPIVLNNLGYCQANLNQLAKAVESYRKALMIKSDGFPEAQFNLGMALRRMGDNAGAEAAFRKAIDDSSLRKKTNPLAQNMLGIILRERGDYNGADRAFRKAILQSGGDVPVAHYNLAVLLERIERSRDAVSEYKTYLRLAPRGKNATNARLRLKRLTGM